MSDSAASDLLSTLASVEGHYRQRRRVEHGRVLLSRGEWEWLVSELGTDKAVLDALDGMARASGYVDANVSVALPFFT